MTTSQPLNIVVVGVGNRGREWIDALKRNAQQFVVAAAVDNTQVHRDWAAERGIAAFASLEEAQACLGSLHGAILALPPRKYAPIRRRCIELGLGFLQEKPAAASLGELVTLQQLLLKRPVPMLVAVQRRYHPSYVELRNWIKTKGLSHIETMTVNISLGRPYQERAGGHRTDSRAIRGGAFIDLGYHAIDLAQFLLLDTPLELIHSSMWTDLHQSRVLSWSVPDQGGTNPDLLTLQQELEKSTEILGRCGGVHVRVRIDRCGTKSEEVIVEVDGAEWRADRGGCQDLSTGRSSTCESAWSYSEDRLLDRFARVLRGDKDESSDLRDHLVDMRVIEAAYADAVDAPLGDEGVVS